MKKQLFSKQVCGLLIGAVGALAPLTSAQAADELSDRYLNGYLNDPYTNEKAADTQSVMPPGEKSLKTADASGAQGPIKDDSAMGMKSMSSLDGYSAGIPELYTGFAPDQKWAGRGAQGPIREDSMKPEPTKTETKRFDSLSSELYNPPYQRD